MGGSAGVPEARQPDAALQGHEQGDACMWFLPAALQGSARRRALQGNGLWKATSSMRICGFCLLLSLCM